MPEYYRTSELSNSPEIQDQLRRHGIRTDANTICEPCAKPAGLTCSRNWIRKNVGRRFTGPSRLLVTCDHCEKKQRMSDYVYMARQVA